MKLDERLAHYLGKTPIIHASSRIAPSAVLIGDIQIGADSSVWPGTVLRADIQSIRIGARTNLQDGCIVHLADDYGVEIGDEVSVGHGAILHACSIGHGTLIGMRATVIDGSVVGEECIVGAHALVLKGTIIPPGSLVLGSPAKVIRPLTAEERISNRELAAKYVETARHFAMHFRGSGGPV